MIYFRIECVISHAKFCKADSVTMLSAILRLAKQRSAVTCFTFSAQFIPGVTEYMKESSCPDDSGHFKLFSQLVARC